LTITRENCPSMEVQVGMQVVWMNGDTVPLAIRLEKYDDGGNVTDIGQSEINAGDYFYTQFHDVGTYRFYCSDNKDVYGMITVE